MSFLSKLFKKKPGGTFVGNLIRTVVGKKSSGAVGNGAMLEQPQETQAEYDARMLQAAGAGLAAAQNAAIYNQGVPAQPLQAVQNGFLTQTVKTNLLPIVGGLIAIILAIVLIFKKK